MSDATAQVCFYAMTGHLSPEPARSPLMVVISEADGSLPTPYRLGNTWVPADHTGGQPMSCKGIGRPSAVRFRLGTSCSFNIVATRRLRLARHRASIKRTHIERFSRTGDRQRLESMVRYAMIRMTRTSVGERQMISVKLKAVICSALTLIFIGGTSVAAPLSQAAHAALKAVTTVSLIEQTHGCHLTCKLGPVWRWGGAIRYHRHVHCVPVRCRSPN
jgi:hypothetical protein